MILDLRRRAGKRDVRGVRGNRSAIKLQDPVHDKHATGQSTRAAVEVRELVCGIVDVQRGAGDGFHRALIGESGAACIDCGWAGLVRDRFDNT